MGIWRPPRSPVRRFAAITEGLRSLPECRESGWEHEWSASPQGSVLVAAKAEERPLGSTQGCGGLPHRGRASGMLPAFSGFDQGLLGEAMLSIIRSAGERIREYLEANAFILHPSTSPEEI